MVLFRGIQGWIAETREVFRDVASSAAAPGCPASFMLPEPPSDLPTIDALMVGQPGAGKSALGNLLIGYGDQQLVAGVEMPRELPGFHEEMVSVARRFPDRYSGSMTIPVSEVQGARLPSLPVVLGVRFTEMWGLDRTRPVGEITGPLVDSHPERAVLVLVVRADQQIDEPESQFLNHVATSPWKDSVLVVCNLRSSSLDPEQVIKLKGFVEEQCVGLTVKPRGVFAFSAADGNSPVDGEFDRFEEVLTSTLANLWTAEHRDRIERVLHGPVGVARQAILDGLELDEPTTPGLRAERDRRHDEIQSALVRHDRNRDEAIEQVETLADRATEQAAADLQELGSAELTTRPRDTLRTFRREAVGAIENRLGRVDDTTHWPVPDFHVLKRPGPGCSPIGAAVICLVVAVVTAVLLQWVVTAIFGGLFALFVSLTIVLALRARQHWYDTTFEAFKSAIAEQKQAASGTIDSVHGALRSPEILVPAVQARHRQLELALGAIEHLESQAANLSEAVDSRRAGGAGPAAQRSGHHCRSLASALAPGTALNGFFHDNGFDLEAPDLFGRVCEVEYAVRPLLPMQTAETIRGWLRPPLGKRERTIYQFLDRLRIRYDEIAARTRTLVQKIVKRTGDDAGGGSGLRIRCKSSAAPGQPPRLAIAEEALEAILGRILDEAIRHSFDGTDSGGLELLWSLQTGASEPAAVLELMLHSGRGFDAAGREGFDSGRGGLARFLSDRRDGALGWCSEIVIESVDDSEIWTRRIDGNAGHFEKTREDQNAGWTTRVTMVFPAVVEEVTGGR